MDELSEVEERRGRRPPALRGWMWLTLAVCEVEGAAGLVVEVTALIERRSRQQPRLENVAETHDL